MADDTQVEARANGQKKPAKRVPTKAKSKPAKKGKATPRVFVSAEQLPRKSVEQALRIARALRDVLAGVLQLGNKSPRRWASRPVHR